MSKFPDCPQSGRLSCTIGEVAEAISAGPSWFEWLALVGVPLLTAVATFLAVYISLKVAREAKRQAEYSEHARMSSELDRREEERQRRFGDSLARFLDLIPDFVLKLDEHRVQMQAAARVVGGSVPPPRAPFVGILVGAINAAKLEGNAEDVKMLDLVREVVVAVDGVAPLARMQKLLAISHLLVVWHRGDDEQHKEVSETLAELIRKTTLDEVKEVMNRRIGAASV